MKSLLYLIFSLLSLSVFAHTGGLDQDGGHYNHKTGEYHYHQGSKSGSSGAGSSLIKYVAIGVAGIAGGYWLSQKSKKG